MKAVTYHGHEDFRVDKVDDTIDGYRTFASHDDGVLKVVLEP